MRQTDKQIMNEKRVSKDRGSEVVHLQPEGEE